MKLSGLTLMLATAAALDRKLYGVDYDTRTSEWGGCKSEWELRADFLAMKSVARNVRIYGTQEPCIDRILKIAAETNVRLFLGLWGNIYPEQDAFDKEFATFKKLVVAGKIRNDNVVGMHVSSEAMFRYYIQDKHDWSDLEGTFKLTSYVDIVRKFVREHGLNFPVTIADVMDSYKYTQQLYPAVDVVAANQFSQWENIWAKDGVNTMFERLKNIQISSRAAGKQILIAETGWSANGSFPSIKEATPEASGLYLREFLLFAEQQNLNFYYFTSFNLKWGDDSAFGLIEKNFGLFDQYRNLLPHVSSVVVGKTHKAVRLWHQGKVIKCDGANTDTIGRVYLEAPTTGLTDSIEREIWFYDEDHKTFRSKSTNQCLDTYVDDNGVSQLHVYWCDVTNANQHWDFHVDGTYEIVSAADISPPPATTPAPTQPPTTTAGPSPAPFLAECGECRNCQFFTPYYSLCYANWSPQDCGLMPKTTHRWCGALPQYVPPPPPPPATPAPSTAAPGVYLGPKATEVRVQVGSFVSLSEKAPGKCIRVNGDALEVVPCNFEDATKFSIRPFETEEVTIRIVDTEWRITENFGVTAAYTNVVADGIPSSQIWFYDPLAKTIRNKGNSQACLELVEDKINGLVEGRLCDSENPQQTWSYNDLTGQIYFMEKMGLCLATYGPNERLHVEFCDIHVRNQKWQFELVQGAYGSGYDDGDSRYPGRKPVPPPCQYVTPPPATKRPVPPPCEYVTPPPARPVPPPCQYVTPPPSTSSRPVPPPCHYETPAPSAPVTEPPTTLPPATTETETLAPTPSPCHTEAPSTAAPVPPPCHTDAPTTTHTRRPLPSPCDKNEKTTTAAPTEAPTTTAAPTEAPTTTAAPTEAPTTTAAPTEAPTTTAAPTEAPTTTAAPTEAPTTTVAPTEAPTTLTPVTTEALVQEETPAPAPSKTRRPLPSPCDKNEKATTAAPTPCHTTAPRSGETTVTHSKHVVISHNKPKTPCPSTTTQAPAPTTELVVTEAPAPSYGETTEAPETEAPATSAVPATTSSLDLGTCFKYKVTVGDSSWAILNKTCSGYSGACKKDDLPTIVNSKGKRCSSLLSVGETVNVCCPAQTTSAPAPEPSTSTPIPTEAQVVEPASTTVPPTQAPTTAAPATEAPTTAAPATEAPTTATPATEAPTTTAAPTEAPTTTAAPTVAPTTTAAPTEAPTTTAAPTEAPTTTVAPTQAPTTAAPTPVVVPTEPVAYINYFIEQHACVGFGASWCQACEWTKETIADMGGTLTFMELDTKSGAGPTGDAISTALTQLTGSTSYPSIWIGGKYIGSSDKIADLDDQGKLKALLQAAGCA